MFELTDMRICDSKKEVMLIGIYKCVLKFHETFSKLNLFTIDAKLKGIESFKFFSYYSDF